MQITTALLKSIAAKKLIFNNWQTDI